MVLASYQAAWADEFTRLIIKGPITSVALVTVDEQLSDGDVLPLLCGLQVVHTSAHHVALLPPSEGGAYCRRPVLARAGLSL
ncbi:hypothetical protein [Hymenobacter crusticola]|uniref:hypothetical protein n=1 Tax=Hymenobacter crusticola TaxID=1770526 RepID=UPI001179DFE5|nr:hypothetical protein [Hymenobacter crusticola]